MASEYGGNKELRDRFMQAVYEASESDLRVVTSLQIMERIGLDPKNFDEEKRYRRIAQHLAERGFIRSRANAYGVVTITAEGTRYVEGDLDRQQAPSTITFNVENAPQSIFGTQHRAEINISLDFKSIEETLDRAEREIDESGSPDADLLRELIAELRAIHHSDEPVRKGQLAKYMEVIQKNGWVASPIASTLLAQVTGGG